MTDAPALGRHPRSRREPIFADQYERYVPEWERNGTSPRAAPIPAPTTAPIMPRKETTPTSAHVHLPADVAAALRALALDVAREMRDAHGDARPIGIGEAARLLLTHEGRLPEPSHELEQRRLAAYRRTLARRGGAQRA